MFNIAHACVTEGVNGPGRRFTVWVQGCPRSCPGCFNEGLRPFEPRRAVHPADLAREAHGGAPIDGVSLSGGEPFAQAAALCAFLDAVRAEPGAEALTALAFTGYTLDELRGGPGEWEALLARLDLVVEGAYVAELPSALPLRGSSNQRLTPLTPEGARLRDRIERSGATGAELTITADGEVILAGFPSEELLAALRRGFSCD